MRHATTDDELAEATRFQRDLYLYCHEVGRARGLPLTGRGFVTRPVLRRIRARLCSVDGLPAGEGDPLETDDLRLLFIRHLLTRLGLLRAAQQRLLTADSAAVQRFFDRPLGERVRLCLRAWVAGGWWPDHLDARVPLPAVMAPAPPRVAVGRRRLLDAVAGTKSGRNDVLLFSPPAIASRQVRGVRDRQRASQSAAPDGETWHAALEGPLSWLGLVSSGSRDGEAPDSASGYRAVTAAAALIRENQAPGSIKPSEPMEPHGRLVAQPNFEVIAYSPLSAPTLATLDACADEAAFGQVCRYRLTRDALRRAHADGWSATDVITRLEALIGLPLPSNVAVTLRDWERQVERVRLTADALVLEVTDVSLLDQLLADPTAASWVDRRVSPSAALLVAGCEASVRSWLLRRGAFPSLIRSHDS